MAERLGFEPRKELPLCRFSRPVLSTAQPSLQEHFFISIILNFNLNIELIIKETIYVHISRLYKVQHHQIYLYIENIGY